MCLTHFIFGHVDCKLFTVSFLFFFLFLELMKYRFGDLCQQLGNANLSQHQAISSDFFNLHLQKKALIKSN